MIPNRRLAVVLVAASVMSLGWSVPEAESVDPGSVFPAVVEHLELGRAPAPTIVAVRAALDAGDRSGALHTAERVVATFPPGRERDAAQMVVGLSYREQQRHNLAADAFAAIRAGGGPLAPYASYYEAEQDLARGREADAVRTCERYRAKWPKGPHAGDCLRIVALSEATLGNAAAARAAARAYDQEHPLGTIAERIELALGTRLASTEPAAAVPILRALTVQHGAALTGRIAEQRLGDLAAAGVPNATIPSDTASRMTRAISLRESGRRDAAWEAFESLRRTARDDVAVAAWVTAEAERFGWQTQRWEFLIAQYGAEYDRTGTPDMAWKKYRVIARAGRFDEASTFALQMQAKHATSPQWRRSEEEVGRTLMLAERYPEARTQFDRVAERGGWTGRRAAFSAAFSAWMAGDAEDAVGRFGSVIDADRNSVGESRYWRARAWDQLEHPAEAAADRTWITQNEPWSWYGSLLRVSDPTVPHLVRDGAWPGAAPWNPQLPEPSLVAVDRTGEPLPLPTPVAPQRGPAEAGFATWQWGRAMQSGPTSAALASMVQPPGADRAFEPPASYQPGTLWNPDAGRTALDAFADQYARRWPELQAINDLASVGLYDLSGPMLNDWFELWRSQVRSRDREARRLSGTAPEAWLQLFFTARDHHHASQQIHGLWNTIPDPEVALEAYRLGYPLAHDRYVWSHSREHDLDPFLVLGLMRQESTYNATARSRVGARGAMQIMPRTGHLLADLSDDTRFDAGDLEDPTLAVGYGIRYLGLLMERFGGVYPLAVAAYNGGPFNVSNWLQGPGADTPMDVFVEHIPFRETRDYVKKVSEGYAAYIALYAPEGSALEIPPNPTVDRREVVDF